MPPAPIVFGRDDRFVLFPLRLAITLYILRPLIRNCGKLSPVASSRAGTGHSFALFVVDMLVQFTYSRTSTASDRPNDTGGVPEWLKGTGCKPVGYAYVGSNPTSSTSALQGNVVAGRR